MTKFLYNINDRLSIITAIDNATRFPESMEVFSVKYNQAIQQFHIFIRQSSDSADLLYRIRNSGFPSKQKMALLKIFRRCVAPVVDTEATKKSERAKPTRDFVEAYGHTFKLLPDLRYQFDFMSSDQRAALAALIGEYDTRGRSGYDLTEMFFQWFETTFEGVFQLNGPRRAGRDIEVSAIFPEFKGDCPCDFVVTDPFTNHVLAIGFARYDATRGGGQSDDRTGGNADKLHKLERFCADTGRSLRLFYLADGPGLDHNDTWKATCDLDGEWQGNVRVTTFKLAPERITQEWLQGSSNYIRY